MRPDHFWRKQRRSGLAAVNRTGHGKQCGIVVDYFGLAHHLKEALNVYADDAIAGALQSLHDEIPVPSVTPSEKSWRT